MSVYTRALTLFLVIAVSGTAWAKRSYRVAVRDKESCKARELANRDCRLKLGTLKVGLLKDTWRFDDGKWLANQAVPVPGDHVEWKEVRLRKMGKRTFVEMYIWGEPEGDAQVQSLNWVVMEIGDFSKDPRLRQVVQRRRALPARSVASGKASKPRYHYDPKERHSLVLYRGMVRWTVGRNQGEF